MMTFSRRHLASRGDHKRSLFSLLALHSYQSFRSTEAGPHRYYKSFSNPQTMHLNFSSAWRTFCGRPCAVINPRQSPEGDHFHSTDQDRSEKKGTRVHRIRRRELAGKTSFEEKTSVHFLRYAGTGG